MSKEILITGHDGMVELSSNLPDGVSLRIRDYDVEGVDPDRLVEDGNGVDCIELIYGGLTMDTEKKSKIRDVKSIVQKAVEKELNQTGVEALVELALDDLRKACVANIYARLGVSKDNWDGLSFRCNSGTDENLDVILEKAAQALRDQIKFIVPVFTPKEKECIQKRFDVTYKKMVEREAEAYAELKARQDVQKYLGITEDEQ